VDTADEKRKKRIDVERNGHGVAALLTRMK
jgi:hypothetical protein